MDDAARTASNVGMAVSSTIGVANGFGPPLPTPFVTESVGVDGGRLVLFVARDRWGYLFNDDPEVVKLVAEVMPYCAIFQVRFTDFVVGS